MTIDGRELRNALGRFATGVCVISAVDAQGHAVGMTANSFASVSLEPPLVLWSLQNSSEVFDSFAGARRFAINVLASDQLEISNQYAKKGDHRMAPQHYRLGRHGAPLLRNALVSFECEQDVTHDGGDHLIIVGRVKDMISRPTGKPLLFHSGAYCELR
ncbi:flavin reductase family protein [Pseudohalioglobus sediminis]|uniref:Flavin reductase family protein n=1 Tax=Pseudohalioglobus sediminis TaxID=2606449 RepID=A0A5B0X328_9GAMM|nr:flavin reductase family protein [Pseudohalioglobus sediminis]KAA1193028.1 flavin reductase family protein [Pseudohalioglobus sediminis]